MRAEVRPNEPYATYGIYWLDGTGPRGGQPYSGPYASREEATQGAQDWASAYGASLELEQGHSQECLQDYYRDGGQTGCICGADQ